MRPEAVSALAVWIAFAGCSCNRKRTPEQPCDARVRTVSKVAGASCPAVTTATGTWSVLPQPAFPYPRERAPRRQASRVRPFCVYEWLANAGARRFPNSAEISALGGTPDCAVGIATPAVDRLPVSVPDPLWEVFARRTRGVLHSDYSAPWRPTISVGSVTRAPEVTVAVIDSTPLGVDESDRSGHGFAIARIIASLACADPDSKECSARIVPFVAMPMVGPLDPPDYRKGGYFGHLFQLYDAIAAALDMWDDERARLIINLSLGWDSVAADEADLLGALTGLFQEASCRGALVIAAGESASKARRRYFPGYLETVPEPSAEWYSAHRFSFTRRGRQRVQTTLAHSVVGVDGEDRLFASAPPGTVSRLAAYAWSASVPGPAGVSHTPTMSGSSVAAAVVSGIAAAVWRRAPESAIKP